MVQADVPSVPRPMKLYLILTCRVVDEWIYDHEPKAKLNRKAWTKCYKFHVCLASAALALKKRKLGKLLGLFSKNFRSDSVSSDLHSA